MQDFVRFSGTNQAVEIFGTSLVGINAENGKKFLFSPVFVVVALLLGRLLQFLSSLILRSHRIERIKFWVRQAIRLATAVLLVIGLVSVWFDAPTRLATALGLVTAGLALAFQKVLTAVVGYFVILRGKIFNVGDRIVMGNVRGDVITLGFTQTTIMEMGQPPSVQNADPSAWVQSRQYTGRIVTSVMPESSMTRYTTIRANSPICGKRRSSPFPTLPIAPVPSASCWMPTSTTPFCSTS